MTAFSFLFREFPEDILKNLEQNYIKLKGNFLDRKYEPSELNGGKFCETVFRLLEWHTSETHSYTPFGIKINDFGQSIRKFENLTNFTNSVRFHIPKLLNAIYDIRNKRGVGHVGGDVNPNYMDSVFVVSACDWIIAELIRIFHQIDTEKAQDIVDGLVTKKIPLIWEIGDVKRVLNPKLSFIDKTLVLLYSEFPKNILENILFNWVEHSNISYFKRDVLKHLHKKKFIEYDIKSGKITISPTGRKYVEGNKLLEFR